MDRARPGQPTGPDHVLLHQQEEGHGRADTDEKSLEIAEIPAFLRTAHRVLLHKYYIDDLYNWLIRYVVFGLSHTIQAFDTYVIDGVVNGVARLVTTIGRDVRHVETGRVQAYMIGFFGGVAVLAILVLVLVTFVK